MRVRLAAETESERVDPQQFCADTEKEVVGRRDDVRRPGRNGRRGADKSNGAELRRRR